MINDKELKLLLYKETSIVKGITFIQPTIKNIIDVGYYNFMLPIYLFFNPKDLLIEAKELYDFLEDKNMDEYETLSYLLDNDNNIIYSFDSSAKPYFSTGVKFNLNRKFNNNRIK